MGTGEFTNQNYILRRDQLKQNEVISFCGLNMQTTSVSLRFFTLLKLKPCSKLMHKLQNSIQISKILVTCDKKGLI